MNRRNLFGVIVLSGFLGLSILGCDIIESIKENFTKSKSKEATKASDVETPKAETKQSTSSPLAPNVLARVGNWSITLEEFNDRLAALKEVVPDYDITNFEAKKLVLEELIRQQLLVMDAQRSGLDKQKDIAEAVEEFRRTLIVREIAKKLTENITVSEEEAKAFYEEQKDKLVEPPQYRISEIVVDSQIKANEILVDLLKGANFADMAKLHSKGPTADKGGDLGFIRDVPFPQMADEVLALEEGGVSPVMKSPDGRFYIVRVDEKKEGKQLEFDDIKEQIIQNRTLFKQQQAILKYIDEIKSQVKVETNESLLK